jgi:hypothetical protein
MGNSCEYKVEYLNLESTKLFITNSEDVNSFVFYRFKRILYRFQWILSIYSV